MEMIEGKLPVCPCKRQTCVQDLAIDMEELICPEGDLVPAFDVIDDAMDDEFNNCKRYETGD